MTHEPNLILTLAAAFSMALVFGYGTHLLRLSPIVGYLLAGLVVGPFTPGFVANGELANELAEVGVILLMFGVGLHFRLRELLAVRRIAIPGALLQIVVATGLGLVLSTVMGWSLAAGTVFGLAISVASTVVLLRILTDHNALHTQTGHIAVGWLIVEDLFTILVLVLLPLAASEVRGSFTATLFRIGLALTKIAGLVVFTFVVGRRALPFVLAKIAGTRSRELFTLAVLTITLVIAVGAAKLFGASMALGAFLAGMVVGQTDFGTRAASEALPMRDAFAVLFFVSVGMLFDPTQVLPNAGLIAGTIAIVLVGKPAAAFVATKLLGYPSHIGAPVAVALAQIGEFSFILGGLGRDLGLLPEAASHAMVATAIVSITANSLLYKLARMTRVRRRDIGPGELTAAPQSAAASHTDRTIVVGYGPVGKTLCRLLEESEVHTTVVELNHETVAELKAHGGRAIYGDASQAEVLEAAGIRSARHLVFAASGTPPEAVIRAAKDLNPELRVLARTTYASEASYARRSGADGVVSAEVEVAMGMAERLLMELGATGEQVDQVRNRVRATLVPKGVEEEDVGSAAAGSTRHAS